MLSYTNYNNCLKGGGGNGSIWHPPVTMSLSTFHKTSPPISVKGTRGQTWTNKRGSPTMSCFALDIELKIGAYFLNVPGKIPRNWISQLCSYSWNFANSEHSKAGVGAKMLCDRNAKIYGIHMRSWMLPKCAFYLLKCASGWSFRKLFAEACPQTTVIIRPPGQQELLVQLTISGQSFTFAGSPLRANKRNIHPVIKSTCRNFAVSKR